MSEERRYDGSTMTELRRFVSVEADRNAERSDREDASYTLADASIDLLDRIEALDRETALLREYVALLETALQSVDHIAYVHGMGLDSSTVAELRSKRTAILAARTEHDEAVVDKLIADAPRKAGRAAIAEARGGTE